MRKIAPLWLLVLTLCCFAFSNSYGQATRHRYLSYIFPDDSIKGFDEAKANQEALNGGFFGSEYKSFMYRAKRNYVNQKYGYSAPQAFASYYKPVNPNTVLVAPCVNEDFESSPSTTSTSSAGSIGSTLAGWTVTSGKNTVVNGSCTMGGCCSTSGSVMGWVRSTPYACPAPLNNIPNSPLGGTKVLQMNDNIPNYDMVRIAQTFPVTASNALFQLAYMAAMNGSSHACCDQPFMKITMLNCSSVPLACPSISITPPGSACAAGSPSGWTVNTSGVSYTANWQVASIDLTPYLGSCVTIEITVSDCTGGAHEGWAFVDCLCSPMTVTINNNQFPIGTSASTVAVCGTLAGTITAPPGLGPYNWNGPGGSGITNNTNQTFTTATAGNYTLTMNPLGACAPITRTVNIQFAANPIATFNTSNACTSYSFTNTGTGAPAIQTYSFVGAGAPPSFTTTATTTVVAFPPSTTFTVYHTVTNSLGCAVTASAVINVPAGPNPGFTFATPQCLVGNAFTFNATTAAGTHTYAFNPTAGAPATGFTNPYGPVSFTSAGTFTVTHTITSGGCTTSASSVIVINPTPTINATNNGPLCTGGNLVLTGSGGGTYSWAGPGFASAVQNPTITSVGLAQAGVYTLTVTLAGCTNTMNTTVAIGTPTTSAANTGPYCAGATIQLSTPAATTYTWSGPSAFASNAQNPTRPGSTLAMAGIYTVSSTNGGCISSATTNVVVNALPTPIAGNNTPVCAGSPINLTCNGAVTYTWSGPSTFTSTNQNPTIASAAVANAGVYTVTVTSASGCTATAVTNVTVNPLPVPVVNNNGPVCVGTTLNLSVTPAGATYAWTGPNSFNSALQNPTIPGVTLAAGGTYTVLVTLNTCTAVGTTNAVVSTATAAAANTGPYCAGQTIQLNTSAATGYTWTGPGFVNNTQNPTRPISTPAMSGTYSLVIAIGTCTASATTSVTVNPAPVPVIASNSPVCANTPINFIGGGGISYFWAGPNTFTSAVQSPTIASATAASAGTYTILVIDANTCTNVATTNVVVNPLPVIVVNNPTVCLNQTINLTSTGGTGYAWSGPGSYASAVQNPNIPNATLAMSGQYTVIVTTAAGCTNSAVSNASVYPLPTPAIISNTPCVGGSLNLQGSGGATFQWSGPGYSGPTQNPTVNNVTMGAGGTYTLLVTSGTCSASTTAVITINPLPNPNINTNSPVCIGNPIIFNGTGGVNYAWAGPAGFMDVTQSPTIAVSALNNTGTYTLVVTDANGCINTTTKPVTVNPQPIVAATGNTVCENSNAGIGASGGIAYSWSGPGGYTSSNQNPVIVGVGLANAGQYTVVVTNANTCTNTAYAVLGINPAPTPSIVTNSPICINNVLSMAGSGGISYSWSGPGGFISTSPSPTIMAGSLSVGGVYYLTATDAKSCTATTSVNTVINPIPSANVIAGPNKGCAPLCVTFTCITNNPTGATFNWLMGNGSVINGPQVATTCYVETGTYSIQATVVDANGCVNANTYTAQVDPHPIADFNYDPYHPIETIDEVHFTDASYGSPVSTWNWYFMNTAEFTSNLQNPTFTYMDAGTYAVALVVKNAAGCSDTVVKSLVVGEDFGIWVPNTFTPNNDGLNDIFYAKGFGVTKFEMQIFDRWGEKIFVSNDIHDAWDGKYQGRGDKTCAEDVYVWRIKVVSVFGKAKELTGHVTLIK